MVTGFWGDNPLFDFYYHETPFGSFGFGPFLPRIKSAFAHLERSAHDFKIEFAAVLEDEFEF